MPVMLDVAVGLVFVYLVLSLLASAIAEGIEHFYRYRAEYLRQGIEKLLLGGDAALREKLYSHALIKSLYTRSWWEGSGWRQKIMRAGGPAYIPTRQFVLALLDVVAQHGDPGRQAQDAAEGQLPPPTEPVGQLLDAVNSGEKNRLLPPSVAQAMRALIADASNDIEEVKTNIGEWFDGSMDRVAGWYKRRAQFVLLVIGIVTAVVVNADTLEVVETLSSDSAVRAAVVAAAEAEARQPLPSSGSPGEAPQQQTAEQAAAALKSNVNAVVSQLDSLGLPVGWRYHNPETDDPQVLPTGVNEREHLVGHRVWPRFERAHFLGDWWNQLASHSLGWLLTAFAVSFGAPFWFDLLNKIMVIRSTVKPREKSREEASEDRQRQGGRN